MRARKILHIILLLISVTIITGNSEHPVFQSVVTAKSKASTKKGSRKNKKAKANKVSSSKKGRTTQSKKKQRKGKRSQVQVIYKDTSTGAWIHRGKKGIVIHRNELGKLRAMAPFSMAASAGEDYAESINQYASLFKENGVRVYSLIAPTQGNFYMPEKITDNHDQSSVIKRWSQYLDKDVTPIFVSDTLAAHTEEEIYSRTDHHWAPLGAYYAAKEAARVMDVSFSDISEFKADTVKNYIGTMYKFSGDPEVLNYPEDFIYFIPPGDNHAEFIDYTIGADKVASSETPSHSAPIFRKFPDGSRAAYSTFLGGDNHTVKISLKTTEAPRRLLIVKDSYGNAMVPYLMNSFDEIHVIDFRHFPHNLPEYIKQNKITDLLFVNCIELAFTPSTSERLKKLKWQSKNIPIREL